MVDELHGREGEAGRGGILPESIRKALVTGISAVFMTEEGIRNALGDMRLPKDAVAYVVQQTEKSRKELFRAVTQELKRFLEGVDLTTAVRKALVGMKVEVKAEVRFVDEGAPKATVKTTVHSDAAADATSAASAAEGVHETAAAQRAPEADEPTKAASKSPHSRSTRRKHQ